MEKEKVVLYVIVGLLVGFLAGAVTGIWFASKEAHGPAVSSMPAEESGSRILPIEDVNRLQDILKADPKNVKALITLGNLYFDAGQQKLAIDAYERALKLEPKNADVRTDMAIMFRGLKDYDRAVKELREAAGQDSRHANSRYNLGVVLLHDKRDVPGAVKAWEDYLQADPGGEHAAAVRKQLDQLRSMAK